MKRFFKKKGKRKNQKTEYVFLDLSNETKDSIDVQTVNIINNKEAAYRNLFSGIEPLSQQRKAVYVNQETHTFVSKIVQSIDMENINIGSFIDTIILLHIKENEDVLRSIYNQQKDDVFGKILGGG
jgi:hypothetical protein